MTKSQTMPEVKVLFVSHLFPESIEKRILDQPIPPVQTQRFGLALLDSLRREFSNNIEVFSVAPLLDFPASKYLLAPRAKWKAFDSIPSVMFPYINLLGLKHITRFIGTLVFVCLWSLHNFKKKRVIILHGVQSCKIWGVLLSQVVAPSIIVPFLTDNLGISLKNEGSIKRSIRRFDVFLMKSGLQKISGVIAMTPWLSENLAPGKPSLIINSILSPSVSRTGLIERRHDDVFTIVYAGGLFQDYGVELLLQAFSLVDCSDWRLIIAGSGDLEERVREAIRHDSRIEYRGFLDSEGMMDLYQLADILVNPRLLSSNIAQMAFPSKIVEYLATGKPVVSTDLPTFDEDFRRHLIITRSDTPEELLRCFYDIATWQADRYELWQNETKRFLEVKLAPTVQGAKIREFLQLLMSTRMGNDLYYGDL